MTVPLWLLAVLLLTILILTIITWSVKRRRRPKLHLDTEQNLEELVPSIVGLTQGTLVGGNDIRLLQNGRFFDELFAELEKATMTINLETFLCKHGEVTQRLADMLEKKAREKVQVRVLVDGNGSRKFGKDELKQMDEAGVRIAKYHPIRISNLGVLNNRDHRKIVVIDGRVA
ncbi:MAG TPA: phospholipase D-like domain-containing protein, partial [Thermoanaerobaculia bacterium]|nr:phospholipase D-like domain-containing protein [Thermoanaerobaculia bacterium]